jgi:NAD(P)-dependent dehydrogenase (short-subunit alcohol dehydrogenase family)
MRGLQNRVAIVTGGAASIGLAITEAFHREGTKVVIVARSADKGKRIVERLGAAVHYEQADITVDSDLDRIARSAVDRFGRIDFVVNNACSYLDQGRRSSREEWLTTLNTNVVSGALLAERCRDELAKTKGAVVNISSISAYAAQTGRWTYPISKAAILHLTRLQALDYRGSGIRVNTLVAGWTQSDPITSLSGGDCEKAERVAADFHLMGRLGRAAEVADGVLFLCSDHASFITGGELKVDGGYLAMGPERADAAIEKLSSQAPASVPCNGFKDSPLGIG